MNDERPTGKSLGRWIDGRQKHQKISLNKDRVCGLMDLGLGGIMSPYIAENAIRTPLRAHIQLCIPPFHQLSTLSPLTQSQLKVARKYLY